MRRPASDCDVSRPACRALAASAAQARRLTCTITHAAPAFSLAEAVVAMLIIGLMFVAAMTAVGASRTSQLKTADRIRGQQLALDLMNEILEQAYWEPDASPLFGREGSESSTSRALWDDVDDYSGWTESPPQNKNGTPIAGFDGWTRSVTVTWTDPGDLTQGCAWPTDLKRITVTVSHSGIPVATLVAVRGAAWTSPVPASTDPTGNRPPTAVAGASPLPAARNSLVTFTAAGSVDRDGDALSYAWKFGDGTTGAGVTATHAYAAAGTYAATLTVSDGRGGKDVDTVTVTVLP